MPVSVKRGPYIVDSNGQILGYSSTEILVKPDSVKRVRPSPLTLRDSTYRTVYSQSEVRVLYRPFPGVSTAETILSSGFEYSGNDAPALDGAVMKLRGKIKNEASNLAVFSAEFRQSCSLFRSLAGELYQGFRAIKRGHLVDAYRDLSRDRGFSKKWIEYQFGLVPLVSDLKSTCDGLADSLRNGIRLQARVSNKDIQTYKRVFRNAYGNIETQEEFYKVDVRLKAEYTISDITYEMFHVLASSTRLRRHGNLYRSLLSSTMFTVSVTGLVLLMRLTGSLISFSFRVLRQHTTLLHLSTYNRERHVPMLPT